MRTIDADALIEFINVGHLRPPTELCFSELDVKNLVDKQPTIERKTGKWIKHSIGHEHTPWGFDCSECGEWFVVGEEVIKKYNYCPNCGSCNGEQPC